MSKKLAPKFSSPEYTITLPISNKHTIYRGYNVADERTIIAAQAAKDKEIDFYIHNMIKTISNCVINDIGGVDKLPSVDARLLMLNIRSKSVGENIQFKLDDVEYSFDIDDIFIDNIRSKDDYKIQLNEQFGLLMKEHTFEDDVRIAATSSDENKNDMIFKLLLLSVDAIYGVGEEDYWKVGEDIEITDVEAFIHDIPSTISNKLYEYIANMPVLAVNAVDSNMKTRKFTNREIDFLALASATSQLSITTKSSTD